MSVLALRNMVGSYKSILNLSPCGSVASRILARYIHGESYRKPKVFRDADLFLDDLPPKNDEPKWKFNKTDKPMSKKSKKESKRPVRSFKHRTEAYMLPFTLDVFISKKYIHASIMHRMSNKVVAVASTNSKDLRSVLHSRCDLNACRTVGQVLAERAMEADVFTALYYTRKNEKLEGKLLAVVDSIKEHGINLLCE